MDNELIKKLTIDSAFGILTRAGLEFYMHGYYCCLFIDFKDVHCLNKVHGYSYVNSLIRGIFDRFKWKDILIGRLFSGDEIVILSKTINPDDIHRYFDVCVGMDIQYDSEYMYNVNTLELIEDIISIRRL